MVRSSVYFNQTIITFLVLLTFTLTASSSVFDRAIIHVLEHDEEQGPNYLAYSLNEEMIVTSTPGKAYIWNARTGERIKIITSESRGIDSNNPIFFSDNKRLLMGGSHCVANIWDVETEQIIQSFEHCTSNPSSGHAGASFTPQLYSTDLSPDETQILTVPNGDPHFPRLWNIDSGEVVAELNFSSNHRSLMFTPDNKYILGGNILMNRNTFEIVRVYDDVINAESLQPNGNRFISFNSDGIIVKNVISGATFNFFEQVEYSFLSPFDINIDNKTVISTKWPFFLNSQPQSIILWDINTGETLWEKKVILNLSGIPVSFSPDGERVVYSENNGKSYILDVETLINGDSNVSEYEQYK